MKCFARVSTTKRMFVVDQEYKGIPDWCGSVGTIYRYTCSPFASRYTLLTSLMKLPIRAVFLSTRRTSPFPYSLGNIRAPSICHRSNFEAALLHSRDVVAIFHPVARICGKATVGGSPEQGR